ncbi:ATP-binding cassette domain-containing protein, partial [Ferrimicrobium acidiphilum]
MKTPQESPAIALRQITKAFGAVAAVKGVDLSINPGETVALLGPNGAGKTTTLDIALGLI